MPSERYDHKAKSIIRIHVAKRELGLGDSEYREALKGQTGKTSCKGMTLGELFTVEAYFKKLGFKPKVKKQAFGKRKSPVSQGRQVDKIRAIWIDMAQDGFIRDGSENALEKWVERQSAQLNKGRGIEKVDWLEQEPYVCNQVLESLKKWQTRAIRKKAKEDKARG
ncbi:hypothetical protein ACH42_09800 [Endozoicomonas sp. (ex Bugula neritina AB1)]|nr:hypothetical protein ACH42_09800 [Endozoicomonas sp. (ex Bugula neritina AB1)]